MNSLNDREYRKFRTVTNGDAVAVVGDGGFSVGGLLADFAVCFVDVSGSVTYVSMEDGQANWCIEKVDESSGTVITYATVENNPTYSNIGDAHTDRASLTYQLPNLAF